MKEKKPINSKKRKQSLAQSEELHLAGVYEQKANHSPPLLQIQYLCQTLEEHFPMEEKTFIDLFPFPNEANYYEVFEQITSLPPVDSATQKAVLLFGNSNLLSFLPELAAKSKLLILADIDWRIHIHNLHLLNCLLDATSPENFFQGYHLNNPLVGIACQGKKRGLENNCPEIFHAPWLEKTLRDTTSYLNEYGFLSSMERFLQCKAAARELSIVTIQFDLTDKLACYQLANILHEYQMNFLLCNSSNIHQYDQKQDLCDSISLLLHHSEDFLIMYSKPMEAGKSDLTTKLTRGLSNYFNDCLPISYDSFRQKLENSSQKKSPGLFSEKPHPGFKALKETVVPQFNNSPRLETG